MSELRIDEFIQRCSMLPGAMSIAYRQLSPTIEFSNSGSRGGKKHFAITLSALISALQDIKNNINKFTPHSSYVEATWRSLFSQNIRENSTNALSTVQTKPLFVALGKIIHIANGLEGRYSENKMSIKEEYLDAAIAYLESQLPDEESYLSQLEVLIGKAEAEDNDAEHSPENIIYYGAPGTGKSYQIKQKTTGSPEFRAVFHPDTQFSDFVGCLKPGMDDGEVVYSFRSGPFTDAIVKAAENDTQHVYLVVEEINRAPAAAVFGEIFQLLDRTSSGESEYSVNIADPDMKAYLEESAPAALVDGKLRIPANLSILATMNSSDQAVMPMDTAFKRRWKFEYVPIDFTQAPAGVLSIPSRDGFIEVSWADFAKAINNELKEHIPEDRLLGHRFLSDKELSSEDESRSALVGKLFMYLWDDVLRHGLRDRLFDTGNVRNIGDLVSRFGDSESVFNEQFEDALKNIKVPVSDEAEAVEPEAEEAEV